MTANAWRLGVAAVLLLAVGLPLLWPLAAVADGVPTPDARLLSLARNTSVLVLLVLALATPAAVLLAVALERTDVPGRRVGYASLVLALFVPLPLVASGWQGVVGAGGVAPVAAWDALAWTPWLRGVGPAAFLHAVAGLPWATLLVARGLASGERGLEEDELLHTGPVGVLWRVALPRAGGAVAAAMLWLAVQTATEITITDLMQVRTFAEEVNVQFVAPEPDPLHPNPLRRAVAVALVSALPFAALVALIARRLTRTPPAPEVGYRPALTLRLGPWRRPASLAVLALTAALVLVPAFGLAWKAGVAGGTWSAGNLAAQMHATLRADAGLLLRASALAVATGAACAALASVACWLARECRWLGGLLLGLMAVAWATPGPVVGLGLKGVMTAALDATGWPRWLAMLLYDGPSSLPLFWAGVVRLTPYAAAIVWPVARLTPRSLVESARLDGAGTWGEMTAVAWPRCRRAALLAALAAGVLSLGELAAGKVVSTPGAEGYAEALFAQMHYGVGPDLAARSLWLLLLAAAGAACVARVARRAARRETLSARRTDRV